MHRFTTETKKKVLDLYLKSAVKRIILEEKFKETNNPCYTCIKAYLESTRHKETS
jgi:hypothetical protein